MERAAAGAAAGLSGLTRLSGLDLSARVGSCTVSLLAWGYIRAAPWRNLPHVHSYAEVCYAYAGEGVFTVGGRRYPVTGGQVFAARPGEIHDIVSSDSNPLGLAYWGWSQSATVGDPQQPGTGEERLLADFRRSRVWVAQATAESARLLGMLAGEAANPRPGAQSFIEGLTQALVVTCARELLDSTCGRPQGQLPAGDRTRHTADQMARYLDDNLARPVTVTDVAAQVHLSARHAARVFQAIHSTTIHDYLRERRLVAAAELLAVRTHTIKEVARACGFPDVRYFTVAFRERSGLTPGVFRDRGSTRFAQP